MRVYLCWKVRPLQAPETPEELRRQYDRLCRGRDQLKSWAEAHDGSLVTWGGTDGCLEIAAPALEDLQDQVTQYEHDLGHSRWGIGLSPREALQALETASEGQTRFYAEPEPAGLQKASQPGQGGVPEPEAAKPSAGGGLTAPGGQLPPVADPEGTPAQDQGQAAPPPPQDPAEALHALAAPQSQVQAQPEEEEPGWEDTKAQVVKILQQFRAQGPQLEALRSQDPQLYRAMIGTVEAMVAMARELQAGPEEAEKREADPAEPVSQGPELDKDAEKAEPALHHHLDLPVGSQKDPGVQTANREASKIKVQDPDGRVHWCSVAAGQVLSPQGHAVSSRNPMGK